jgi:hypothetical protein
MIAQNITHLNHLLPFIKIKGRTAARPQKPTVQSIQSFLVPNGQVFHESLRDASPRAYNDGVCCGYASRTLALVLAKKFGTAIGGAEMPRVELPMWVEPFSGIRDIHVNVRLTIDADNVRLIDPTAGQYKSRYIDKILFADQKEVLSTLSLTDAETAISRDLRGFPNGRRLFAEVRDNKEHALRMLFGEEPPPNTLTPRVLCLVDHAAKEQGDISMLPYDYVAFYLRAAQEFLDRVDGAKG